MTTIITKNGSGAPTAGQLSEGELAVDLTNKELYTKSGSTVIKIGSQGGSSGTFTDLTATSSFTSPGIDDNATSTAITIDANENVGIGMAPAAGSRLQVDGYVSAVSHTTIPGSGGAYGVLGSTRMEVFDTPSQKQLAFYAGTRLVSTLNSDGSATFSSNVNANKLQSEVMGASLYQTFTLNGKDQPQYGINWSTGDGAGNITPVGISGYYGIDFATGGASRAAISAAGDATFNGSVTANSPSNTGVPTSTIKPSLLLMGGLTGAGEGGELGFGAFYTQKFAAIKGAITDAAGKGSGFLDFYIRKNTLANDMDRALRLNNFGNAEFSGNVGIGLTPSSLIKLHTYGINSGTPTTSGNSTVGVAARFQTQSVNMDFGTYSSGACFIQPRLVGNNAHNYDLVLNPNGGNVGIGTATPTNSAAYSTLDIRNTLGGQIVFGRTSSIEGYMYSQAGLMTLAASTGNDLRFLSNASGNVGNSMTLDTVGNLVLGSPYSSAKLTVAHYGGADREVLLAGIVNVSDGFKVRYISGAMQYVFTGLGNGTVTCAGGVLSASSDQNMKIDDGCVDNALDKISALTPRYFYWKDEDGNSDLDKGRQLGFFAQEVNKVVPEAAPTPTDDQNGWGVLDRSLVATLVKATQEQQAMIETLQAEVAALKGA